VCGIWCAPKRYWAEIGLQGSTHCGVQEAAMQIGRALGTERRDQACLGLAGNGGARQDGDADW
jgi:hypothetical protein